MSGRAILASLFVLAFVACAPLAIDGRAAYAENCASCHGDAAHGDGPMAGLVPGGVPDLTGIAARAGGRFPRAEVTATVDRISLLHEDIVAMPDFGHLLGGRRVGYTAPDGRTAETSVTVIAIVNYLETLQR